MCGAAATMGESPPTRSAGQLWPGVGESHDSLFPMPAIWCVVHMQTELSQSIPDTRAPASSGAEGLFFLLYLAPNFLKIPAADGSSPCPDSNTSSRVWNQAAILLFSPVSLTQCIRICG